LEGKDLSVPLPKLFPVSEGNGLGESHSFHELLGLTAADDIPPLATATMRGTPPSGLAISIPHNQFLGEILSKRK
jgi:hypothetical protein